MLNLLPQEQKIGLEREYKTRRLLAWTTILLVILAISLLLLVPSYILSQTKTAEVKGQLEHTKNILDAELQPNDLTNDLTEAARNARDMMPFTPKESVYSLIKLFESKPASIKITNITYLEKKGDDPTTMTLAGIAADRESLKAFGRLMEARAEFSKVDLPVSNFAKERNIDFNITIIVK